MNGFACQSCGTALTNEQRYCLTCGSRSELAPAPPVGGATPPEPQALIARRRWWQAMPLHVRVPGSLRASEIGAPVLAAALAVTLLTGVALGGATESSAGGAQRYEVAMPPAPLPPGTTPGAVVPSVPSVPSLPSPSIPAPPTLPPVASVPDLPAVPDVPATPSVPDVPSTDTGSTDTGSTGTGSTDTGSSDTDTSQGASEPGSDTETDTGAETTTPPSAVDRVLVVALAGGQSYDALFGDTADTPTLGQLAERGTVLTEHYAVAPTQAVNSVALLSGQGATSQLITGCRAFGPVGPATIDDAGLERGDGCVYSVQTGSITTQLDQVPEKWRTFVEGQAGPCAIPAVGQPDPLGGRNPIAFLAAASESGTCKDSALELGDLAKAYEKVDEAPKFAYVAPAATDPAGIEKFLSEQLAPALQTDALSDRALVVVTQLTGDPTDRRRAGAPAKFPNTPEAFPGGGRVGALVIGGGVAAGKTSDVPSNHYALLRLTQDVLGLEPLGYAKNVASRGLKRRLVDGDAKTPVQSKVVSAP